MNYRVHCVLFIILTIALFLPTAVNANILVISPHPDDDILNASGVIYRAIQRAEPLQVVYMTNGDYGGISKGYIRQGEAVNGEAILGVDEDHLIFLGYPDYYLGTIYENYPTIDDVYTSPNGQSTTYGNRGLGRTDYHTYCFGSPAFYNRYNMVLDLKSIIHDFRPDHIFVPCEFDSLDHETTYNLLALALSELFAELAYYNPTIHKTTIWPPTSGDWPNPFDPNAYFEEIPDFSHTGLLWAERESLDVPLAMQSTFYPENLKQLALDAHASQGGGSYGMDEYLHKDEFFWVEQQRGTNQPPVVHAGFDQLVEEGSLVQLDGSGSFDHNGDTLIYQWSQAGGRPVTLVNPASATPAFTAPAGLLTDEVLTFELIVSDGELITVPDAVNVTVLSPIPKPTYTNIAPLASSVTASSEASTSSVLNAVDGCIDGYPGDSSCEWVATGKVGSWIELSWDGPVTVGKISFYDRINRFDQITAGTVTFSDGSSMTVGPLENKARAVEYIFLPRLITSLRMTVTGVSSVTGSVGLAEIEVFEQANRAPYANSGPDQTAADESTVQLDGSGSFDPDGDILTFQWNQTGGIPVSLSNATTVNPTFTAPSGLSTDEVLDFELIVSDGEVASTPDTVTITVLAEGVCGNGSVEGNEQCDDGNTLDGDCCSSLCTFEPAGIPCEDGAFCTVGDTCDDAGTCQPGTGDPCAPVGCVCDEEIDYCTGCDADDDGDGICTPAQSSPSCHGSDNCPKHPNSSDIGTCVTTKSGIVLSYQAGDPAKHITCKSDADCIATGGTCQLEQGDCNNNGAGDACECYADCNSDTKVNLTDLVIIKNEFLWNDCAINPCQADCNGDNTVNLSDLTIMKVQFFRNDCAAIP